MCIYHPSLTSFHPRCDVSNGQSMVHHWVLVGIGLAPRPWGSSKPDFFWHNGGVDLQTSVNLPGCIRYHYKWKAEPCNVLEVVGVTFDFQT